MTPLFCHCPACKAVRKATRHRNRTITADKRHQRRTAKMLVKAGNFDALTTKFSCIGNA